METPAIPSQQVIEEEPVRLSESSSSSTSSSVSSEEHPLQTPTILVQDEFTDDRTLLDDQGRPNISRAPSVVAEVDTDTSHAKGFYNVSDSKDVVDLEVVGQLPDWLVSEHYTVGPGVYDVRYSRKIEIDNVLQSATSTFTLGHWFDALPLINRLDINGERNTVTYRHHLPNRRLNEKIRDHHGYAPSFPAGLFKTNPNQTMLIKFLNNGKKPKPDRVPCGQRISTYIPGIEGRLFCQDFANHVQTLDPFDLSPSGLQTWDEINPEFKGYSSCPNGQYDSLTEEYINFTMEIGYKSTKYHFFSITDGEPKGRKIATIWNAPTGWVNNFAITPNYIIMVIHPMLANSGAVRFAWSESILDSFYFEKSEPTLFYVISRKDNDVVACYRSEASLSLNQVNAYEDVHGSIVIDMACYDDDRILSQLATESLRNPKEMGKLQPAQIRRYILGNPQREAHDVYVANNSFIPSAVSITSRIGSVWNYVTGSSYAPENATGSSGWHAWMPIVTFEQLAEATLELPQINPNYKMQQHAFVYGLGFHQGSHEEGKIWDSIIKIDVNSKSVVASWHEENCYPSEAQFVPKPIKAGEDKTAEDAGVLISIVLDSARSTSFVLVLNAQDLEVMARVELNKLIPISFAHGTYRLRST
ncbi:carotenoid oxygenase [Mucor mucedo]|uniref:carotenoid oxygenase n=1 Tax=Mucor mucedo TaxID=29922 RepID=UPI00221E6D30|nr:carotenoid oxygenase [Mucor mucedo]KAI7888680.1 carotenoid oxygenase [Mucor mucedo]